MPITTKYVNLFLIDLEDNHVYIHTLQLLLCFKLMKIDRAMSTKTMVLLNMRSPSH